MQLGSLGRCYLSIEDTGVGNGRVGSGGCGRSLEGQNNDQENLEAVSVNLANEEGEGWTTHTAG